MTARTESTPVPALFALRAVYALHYAATGLTVPYLAPFLESAGVSGTTQGFLFALRNAVYVITQPMLGVLADRAGVGRVLKIAAAIAGLTWLFVLRAEGPLELAAIFLLMAFGVSTIASLVDAAVLGTLEGSGGGLAGGPRAFARSRVWGSVGFAAAAIVFGLLVPAGSASGARGAITAVALLQIAAAIAALGVPARPGASGLPRRPPALADALRILRTPGVALVLASGALHWITLAPYHTFFGAHVAHHGGGPMTIGLSIAVSVAVELVVMATAPYWLSRFAPRNVMAVSTAAGVIRWSLTAVGSPAVIIAAQTLHGLSYGAFFLSMVDSIVRRTPPERRATAQALIAALGMGLGTFLGNLVTGPLYDLDHGRTLFLAAAGFSVVSAAVALAIPPVEPVAG